MRFHFRKKKVYTMDLNAAGETLQNVLNACHREPSNIPFDVLLMRQKPKTRFYKILQYITLLLLLLTFLSPLAFKHSPVICEPTTDASGEFTLDSHYVMNGNLYLQFYGGQIDPAKSYMITDSGAHFTYSSYNAEKGLISFPYDGEGANIYVESTSGTVLQILMTLRNN